eukprot:354263-Chlamydomonas_euryale.AAC.2
MEEVRSVRVHGMALSVLAALLERKCGQGGSWGRQVGEVRSVRVHGMALPVSAALLEHKCGQGGVEGRRGTRVGVWGVCGCTEWLCRCQRGSWSIRVGREGG